MRNDIHLTDDQIEQLFDKAFQVGLTVDEVIFTRDTLSDFDTACSKYSTCGVPNYSTRDGHKTLFIPRAQPRKGDPRRDIHIIDFGTVRGVFA